MRPSWYTTSLSAEKLSQRYKPQGLQKGYESKSDIHETGIDSEKGGEFLKIFEGVCKVRFTAAG